MYNTISFCWVGWYGTWPNCTECPAGKYATNTGKEVDTACTFTSSTCPWGHYCVSSMRVAQRCPTGRYGNLIGQSTVAQACPNFCAPGKYSVLGNTEVTACIICPVAHYCDGNGSKTACAKGKFGFMIFGLVLSVILTGALATYLANYIQKNLWIAYIGLGFILIVAIQLVIGGLVDLEILSINEEFKKYF